MSPSIGKFDSRVPCDSIRFIRSQRNIVKEIDSIDSTILGPQARKVLDLAFEHGAYVAGGFAHVAFSLLFLREKDAISRAAASYELKRYLGDRGFPIDFKDDQGMMSRGDIDVFFQTKQELLTFKEKLDKFNEQLPQQTSPGGLVTELMCDKSTRVQVINGFIYSIEDQLRRFDIQNAMIAFNRHELIEVESWRSLCEARKLHVINWASPRVFLRISKWFNRHDLIDLTDETKADMVDYAIDAMSALKKQPMPTMLGHDITYVDIASKLKKFLDFFSDKDLLKLAMIYDANDYDGPLSTLKHRSTLPWTKNNRVHDYSYD